MIRADALVERYVTHIGDGYELHSEVRTQGTWPPQRRRTRVGRGEVCAHA